MTIPPPTHAELLVLVSENAKALACSLRLAIDSGIGPAVLLPPLAQALQAEGLLPEGGAGALLQQLGGGGR